MTTEFNSSFTTISTTEGDKYICDLREGDLITDGKSVRKVKSVRRRNFPPPQKEGIQILNIHYLVEDERYPESYYEDSLCHVSSKGEVKSGKGYTRIFELREGDLIETKKHGKVRIHSIEVVPAIRCNEFLYSIELCKGSVFYADQILFKC